MTISVRENSISAAYSNNSMVKSPLNNSYANQQNSIGNSGNSNTRADFNSINSNTLDRSRANNNVDAKDDPKAATKISSNQSLDNLSESEKRQVEELKRRDREVKAHEAAHLAAGGGLVRGGASYSYTMGPDNKRYATGGEVQIDISPASDPESTILKMQQVRRAALAPADPSAQDRSVARTATKIESEARREIQQEKFSDDQEKEIGAEGKSATKSNDLTRKYIDVIADTANSGSLINAFAQ